MNCDYCQKEYTPKQRFCSAKCRVYHFRNKESNVPIKVFGELPKIVSQTSTAESLTVTLQEDVIPDPPEAKELFIGKNEAVTPFGLCNKHKGSTYSTCHC